MSATRTWRSKCPSCGTTVKASEAPPAGKKVRCPKCRNTFKVPERTASKQAKSKHAKPAPVHDFDLDNASPDDSLELSLDPPAPSPGDDFAFDPGSESAEAGTYTPAYAARRNKNGNPGNRRALMVIGLAMVLLATAGVLFATGVFDKEAPREITRTDVADQKSDDATDAREPEPEVTNAYNNAIVQEQTYLGGGDGLAAALTVTTADGEERTLRFSESMQAVGLDGKTLPQSSWGEFSQEGTVVDISTTGEGDQESIVELKMIQKAEE